MKNSLALLTLLAACGDNASSSGPDANPADGGPDAPPAAPRAVVVSGDFVTPGFSGVMSALALDTMEMSQRVAPNGAIGADPLLRKVGNELFVVNRADGNNVTILDASTFQLVEQLATGAGTNPQDVAVVGAKLFVPAMGTAGVVVATRGSTATTTIDLSDLDPDGKPDCVSAYAVGSDVYVACGMLDQSFAPRGVGKVVVIDGTTNARKGEPIALTFANPFGVFEEIPASAGGGLVIPTVSFVGSDGCVERVSTGATPANAGCVVTNAALGGYAGRIEMQRLGTTTMMWMIVPNGMFGPGERSRLEGYDLGTSELWPDPITPEEQLLVDVAVCPNDLLVVADRTMTANGLRVYESATEKTSAPLAIGLKPGSSRGVVCY